MKFTKKELEHIKAVYSKIWGSADFSEEEEKVIKSIFDKVSK